MGRVTAIDHLAISTADMKASLAFYCGVLRLPLVGLFRMHGVPGAVHAFVDLGSGRHLSFIQFPKRPASIAGTTHAEWPGQPTAAGTMQHLALHVDEDDFSELLERLVAAGCNPTPPLDHGFCRSVYFRGPDDVCLELTATLRPFDAREIDGRVVSWCGLSDAELAAFRSPS